MGSKWEKIKLKEVVDIITTKVDVSQISLCDYISTENMLTNFGGISIANSKPSTGKITKFHSGDILFSNIRTYFKKLWLADRTGGCSNDVIVFRPKKNINSNYILSVLMDQKFIEYTVLTSKGTKMPRGDKTAILDYEFNLAPDKYCQHIAKTNTLIFSKLKSNEVINKSLEQMSQTLFKSWFVDFDPVIDNALDAGNPIPEALQSRAELRQKVRNSTDFKPLPAEIRSLFPSEFEETELGWVPKDWSFTALKNFGKIICGKTPSKSNKNYYGEDFLFIKIPDMHGKVFVTNSHDKLSKLGSESQSKKIIPHGSICVSCIATVGLVSINAQDCHTNQQINSIVPNSPYYRNYLYFSMLEKYKIFHDLASGGSATLNMNTSVFSNIAILMPNNLVLKQFHKITEPWFEAILLNEYKLTSLASLRDTLLPKLISGELSLEDLPDLNTDTEAA
ncbi:restriction endonuclease subunit S [Escherichia coli]|uniref:restriction endonuclease subunit S n=1 Tax=Escherichia coli TaxID=562 RepID=UPI000E2066A2|nr:restriction endonuclease subunit S [Escherichia coli]EET3364701.1 restriction endonuclease subunit S [Escherichia coli]EET9689074.1 restriction endonuclease subunit S [Escherichia coli]EEW1685169.1 restriction endonuclease subunit S [Escherichia coli]EFC4675345.1 restriction endonuclease subunit S [Escherichia coli]EFH6267663.1 restriction endonuclease subunit S [Escherichia coli]